jgi:aminopeptidase
MRRSAMVVVCALALMAPAVAPAAPAAKAPSMKVIAKQVVQDIARVKEGDMVLITGDLRDWALLEEIELEVNKRGGATLVFPRRELAAARYFAEVPARYMGKPAALAAKLWPQINVQIAVEGEEHPGLLKGVPPARLEAYQKSWIPVVELIKKQGVRRVFLGNGLYPTEATAKQYGLTKDQLAKIFYGGLAVSPARLRVSAEAVRAKLAKGHAMHIKGPNGTDLSLRIEGRPVTVSDGSISDAKLRHGGVAAWTYLPAGEVMTTPVPGTAEGTLVFDRFPFEDGEVEGLTLTIKGGKVKAMTAKAGPLFNRLKARYAAAPARKDELSCIDFGVNPNVTIPPGSKLRTWIPAGTVTVTTGPNPWCGGDIAGTFGLGGFLVDATVTIDGRRVVEKGVLKVGPTAKK